MSDKPLTRTLTIFFGILLAPLVANVLFGFARSYWRHSRIPGSVTTELPSTLNPNSFLSWCNHRQELSSEAQITIKVILDEAGTDNCWSASQKLATMSGLTIASTSSCPEWLSECTGPCNEYRIYDLRPLASLTHFTRLTLSNQNLDDISPLAKMTNLEKLTIWVRDTDTDVSALESLENLEQVAVYHQRKA
ncbi:hypothetical protein Pse7367_0998 [Thalassoporum mexicanum PCC 7367]|nr:hypothetical protein Pse7367_0998 [Pseudanabaena sp. PCC 7367]